MRLRRTALLVSAIMAAAMVASCTAEDTERASKPVTSAPVAATASPICDVEAQPRFLVAAAEVWTTADLDAMSTRAFQLSEGCDEGKPWPQDCDGIWADLDQGWKGFRSGGVHYTATLDLLSASGDRFTESLMLFRIPRSDGRQWVLDQATKCGATAGTPVDGAQVYLLQAPGKSRRVLVVDEMAAVMLTSDGALKADQFVESALRHARTA